jgi:hypothetical protein
MTTYIDRGIRTMRAMMSTVATMAKMPVALMLKPQPLNPRLCFDTTQFSVEEANRVFRGMIDVPGFPAFMQGGVPTLFSPVSANASLFNGFVTHVSHRYSRP